MNARPSWFQRLILPGFAFKALVIGGGYATGRELASYFLPSGPWGGLYGLAVAALAWSVVGTLTFLFALKTGARDYQSFFAHLLGPFWPLFEVTYLAAVILILAAFAAAAGAIAHEAFGWPDYGGIALFAGAIILATTWGNRSVEGVFKYVSVFLYGTYGVFVIIALTKFGDRTIAALNLNIPAQGWVQGGLTYAGYNILGAVLILPVLRHLTSRRDAVIAGALAGPLTIIPAVLFYLGMLAFYPDIGNEQLPSDFLLGKMELPLFRTLFELMILAALTESATGGIHAINERISQARIRRAGRPLGMRGRVLCSILILFCSVVLAAKVGLVDLIAQGYQYISYAIIAVYVLPLLIVSLIQAISPARLPVESD